MVNLVFLMPAAAQKIE